MRITRSFPGFQSIDFPFDLEGMNVALITLDKTGYFPENGWKTNLECDMVVFVFSGNITLEEHFGSMNETCITALPEGSVCVLEKEDVYRWIIGEEPATLFTVCNPPWKPEQSISIE